MRYRLLGRSGLRVSELALGTMAFGEDWGWGASKGESARVFEAFVQAGGNLLDTADHYTNGTAERYLGEFVGGERDHFVIGTKYSLSTGRHPNAGGNHRKNMVESLEGSLTRLGTDYVDLYWVHIWDFTTPVEEVMRAMDDLVRAGKVLHAAVSDAPAWLVAQANTLAGLRGWSEFVAVQVRYNLLDRAAEREFLPMSRALDVAVLAWEPLASGLLTGKYDTGRRPSSGARLEHPDWSAALTDRRLALAQAVNAVAGEVGCSPSQLALAWLRSRAGVVVPVVGARTRAQMLENLSSLDVELGDEIEVRLDRLTAVDLGFPHDMLLDPNEQRYLHGEFAGRIDNHRAVLEVEVPEATADAD
jgi:aryl-alcohol dehydrogenase-like predicted oxidoreductase